MDLLPWISWDARAPDSGTARAAEHRLRNCLPPNANQKILSACHPEICRRTRRRVGGARSDEGMRICVRGVVGLWRAVEKVAVGHDSRFFGFHVHLRP